MRQCRTCLKEKPYYEYQKQKHNIDGLSVHCKTCTAIKRNKYKKRKRTESEPIKFINWPANTGFEIT